MRKIKIDGIVHSIDKSDGRDAYSAGCNGLGGMSIYIDGMRVSDNGYIEGTDAMLDGEVNYTCVKITPNRYILKLDDENYKRLAAIHSLTREQIENIPLKDRIEIIEWGLKYEYIEAISNSYRFGKEITFNDFSICFNKKHIIVFKSSHDGYIAPDFINIGVELSYFYNIFELIKKSIFYYFGLDCESQEAK